MDGACFQTMPQLSAESGFRLVGRRAPSCHRTALLLLTLGWLHVPGLSVPSLLCFTSWGPARVKVDARFPISDSACHNTNFVSSLYPLCLPSLLLIPGIDDLHFDTAQCLSLGVLGQTNLVD